jgi:hypothetical protein
MPQNEVFFRIFSLVCIKYSASGHSVPVTFYHIIIICIIGPPFESGTSKEAFFT